jgi:uncharacterized DUF497 family protein
VVFEFDPAKSARNKAKHGIDFEEAQQLWQSKTVSVRVDFPDELRRLVVGVIDGKHWTAIVTERAGRTRLISVRRSREKECEIYEQEK